MPNWYNPNNTESRCDVTMTSYMVTSVTVTMVNQNMISFIHVIIILKWLSFDDSKRKSPWVMRLCDASPGDVTIKSPGDSYVTVIWKLHCKVVIIVALWLVPNESPQWSYLVICKEMVTVTSNIVSGWQSLSGYLIWKSLRRWRHFIVSQ